MKEHPPQNKLTISENQLLGCLSFGYNKPGIFLALCRIFRDLKLDIIEVDSHVRLGWFSKLIIARNKHIDALKFDTFKQKISSTANSMSFKANCFVMPEKNAIASTTPGMMIVVIANNRIGLLADLLEELDKFNLDIIDIRIEMESDESSFALILYTKLPMDDTEYFQTIENIRSTLSRFKSSKKMEDFRFLIHSEETFKFINKIDYEYPLPESQANA